MSIVRRVIERVAQVLPDRPQDEIQGARRYLGQPVDRLDGVEKVTGEARFAADMPVDHPAYAVLVTSSIAKGRLTGLELDAARAVPGVSGKT